MKKLLFLLFFSLQLIAVAQTSLPRSTPEAEGVSSEKIIQFVDAVHKSNIELHSFMVLRHGKVVAEGWWKPYRPDLRHTMYSVSKSFAATAVGFAVSEKLLTVDDKVISFFPDKLPAQISPNLAALRVKDLLTMSVGMEKEPIPIVFGNDWISGFLGWDIENQPGSKFLYNSMATYMLSAIVQKVTGQRIVDYLQPRLFEPLGIRNIDWETDPAGINVGGWGLRLKTEDMAKFGQLFLQKGMWQGKQILPAAWVEEASAKHIVQNPKATPTELAASDWLQGYGYQMWRSRNNAYRGDGANGQYIIILPEKDAVVIATAESPDMQSEINLIWQHLLPAFQDKKLPKNRRLNKQLKAKLASLALPIPTGVASAKEQLISGKTFTTTDKKLPQLNFQFDKQQCTLTLKTDSVTHQIPFSNGQWAYAETTKLGPYLVALAQNNRVGLPPFKVAGSYAWKDEKTLMLTLRYIESPHTETIMCSFEGDTVSVDFTNIFNAKDKRVPIVGTMK